MRVTVLQPGSPTDVEVDEGVTVAGLRGRLAALTGDQRWRSGTLTADGEALHDDHPAGRAPLRHGALVRHGTGPVPDSVAAARAERHLAVVAGTDTGALLVPDRPATLGPGGDLPVDDDGRWLVRLRPGRRALLVRGAAGRVTLGRPGRRRARLVRRRRWTRWRDGEELRAGPTTVVARTGAGTGAGTAAGTGAGTAAGRGAAAQGAAAPARPDGRRLLHRLGRFLPAVAGAATAAALAASMHQPVLLLGALSALLLVGPRAEPAPPTLVDEVTDQPGDLAQLRVALARGDAPGRVASPVPWQGDLALAGPREPALRLARALLLSALVDDPRPFVVRTDRPADWSWLAWLAGTAAGSEDDAGLVVLDGPAATRWHPGTRVLRLVGDVAPPWCGRVLEVGGGGARLRDAHGARPVPVSGVSAGVAEAVARAAGRPRPGAAGASAADLAACPARAVLGHLPGIPDPEPRAVARAWAAATSGARTPALPVPIGLGPGGIPVVADLVADGPHALVAGTTGSGKSELLATLVLGLALTQPPDRLAVVLVDFKGGTGLPPSLAALPHVTGHLSDLDAAGARRTVRGLFAELRRRERVLAAHGATDLRDLDPTEAATPPRLLVVIDEFRALADDLPDLLPGLARLAAQGRSLGVHLVLATQRPTGAVPADLRANVGLRIALRVADPADSVDLVGVGDAARIARPGLALLVRGAGRAEAVQVARAVPRPARPVRLAPAWDATPGWAPRTDAAPAERSAAEWVRAMTRAGGGRARQPWLAPLPEVVRAGDIPAGPGLPLALADLPDDLARGPVRWDPDSGHLLVTGGPGSGRSTALAAAARAALAGGRTVHCVGVPTSLLPDHPRLASRLDIDDVTRVARLVRLLARPDRRPAPGSRPLLVLDDAPGVLAALAGLAHGAPADLLAELWANASGPVAVAAAGAADAGAARLAPCFADRLVLGSPDPSGDALQGVPTHLAGPRPQPGRAIHLARGVAALCQVTLPGEGRSTEAGRAADTDPAAVSSGDGWPPEDTVGVRPLPTHASRPRHDGGQGAAVTLGLGGDDAGPVHLDLDGALLVAGPPGSGRSRVLEVLAEGAARVGLPVVRITGGTLPDDPDALLVLDDLDGLEARDPALAEALAARLAGGAPLRLAAATTTAHAVSAYHGAAPALVRARRVLVLDASEPGSLDLLGAEGAWLVDPRRRAPGRGVLRLGRELVPVQVWAPEPPGAGGGAPGRSR